MTIAVLAPFTAFQRGYVAGQVLTDADLECWPSAQRAAKITSLIASSNVVVAAAVPAPAAPVVSPAEIAATEAFEKAKADETAALAQLEAAKAAK